MSGPVRADDGDVEPTAGRSSRVYLTTLRHDLRAPISAIIGYADLLAEDLHPVDDATYVEDLGKIRSAGHALLELVDDLFDPTTIAAGALDLSRVGTHLRHELRTPLNHVIGYSEMLAEEAADEDRHAFVADLGRIRESGLSVLRMIDEVLRRAAEGAVDHDVES